MGLYAGHGHNGSLEDASRFCCHGYEWLRNKKMCGGCTRLFQTLLFFLNVYNEVVTN